MAARLRVDERALTERLIRYDTSDAEGIRKAAGFVKGWLESRDIERRGARDPRPAGADGRAWARPRAPTVVLHGHLDVVPGARGAVRAAGRRRPPLRPRRLRHEGRARGDDGRARRSCATQQRRAGACSAIVPDEESEEEDDRGTELLIEQRLHAATSRSPGEPTDLHIGVAGQGRAGDAARGQRASRRTARRRGSGDNAILKALDVFRAIESLPFARESSDLFDRPSINLGRILGGDALNKVPDRCVIDVDIRYLPGQDPTEIRAQVARAARRRGDRPVPPRAGDRRPQQPLRARAARERVHACSTRETISVGRDGASDAISFLDAGVPAVEFGPVGGGHHGPDEWVSVASLESYRQHARRLRAPAGSPDRDRAGDKPPPARSA